MYKVSKIFFIHPSLFKTCLPENFKPRFNIGEKYAAFKMIKRGAGKSVFLLTLNCR